MQEYGRFDQIIRSSKSSSKTGQDELTTICSTSGMDEWFWFWQEAFVFRMTITANKTFGNLVSGTDCGGCEHLVTKCQEHKILGRPPTQVFRCSNTQGWKQLEPNLASAQSRRAPDWCCSQRTGSNGPLFGLCTKPDAN